MLLSRVADYQQEEELQYQCLVLDTLVVHQ